MNLIGPKELGIMKIQADPAEGFCDVAAIQQLHTDNLDAVQKSAVGLTNSNIGFVTTTSVHH